MTGLHQAVPFLFIGALLGCRYEGDSPGECTDDADNDRDGLFDCADPGCQGAASCSDTTAAGSTSASTTAPTTGATTGGVTTSECSDTSHLALYERYIEPLLTDAHPSSCNQCHLSGVDLSMYIQDTPCQSMACMIEQSVVDLTDPEASQILSFILQAEPDSDLITEDVISLEYEGFLEWIEWSETCHEPVCGTIEDPCQAAADGNVLPDDTKTPLGSCDEDALVASFEDLIWSHHGRCWACHHVDGQSHEEFSGATTFYEWTGDDTESARLTMYNLIGVGAIDAADPPASSLLTKPMAEDVSASTGLGTVTGVWHGGSDKYADGTDETLIDSVTWIQGYLSCLE